MCHKMNNNCNNKIILLWKIDKIWLSKTHKVTKCKLILQVKRQIKSYLWSNNKFKTKNLFYRVNLVNKLLIEKAKKVVILILNQLHNNKLTIKVVELEVTITNTNKWELAHKIASFFIQVLGQPCQIIKFQRKIKQLFIKQIQLTNTVWQTLDHQLLEKQEVHLYNITIETIIQTSQLN